MTAQTSSHVQNCVAIVLSEFGWKNKTKYPLNCIVMVQYLMLIHVGNVVKTTRQLEL